jgi:hypothetical protein
MIREASSSKRVAFHRVFRQQQLKFAEFNDQAEWGYWYYATRENAGLSYQSGPHDVVRLQFAQNGSLANSEDTRYRPINEDFPIFGYAQDLGSVGKKAKSTLFQLSLHQRECVQFQNKHDSVAEVPCLWNSYFPSDHSAVSSLKACHGILS